MKNFKVLLLVTVLTFIILPEISGKSSSDVSLLQDRHRRPRHHTIGAPLDGGILAILGAAGAGYFIIRKRKKDTRKS